MKIRLQSARAAVAVMTLVSVATLLAGCGSGGPEKAYVSGKVTYKGQPVPKGLITFVAQDPGGRNATGNIQSDGSYKLQTEENNDGAIVGKYKVTIAARDEDGPPPQFIPAKPIEPKRLAPQKYEDPKTSELEQTVKSGSNTFNFELVD